MGRIQSSIGLITGTNITGTVDQLMAISGKPRDRLIAQNETRAAQQQTIAELTASVIGVQLGGDRLKSTAIFRSKKAESSNTDALSATTGNGASPASHTINTIQTAATHDVRSLQRFASNATPLGFTGKINVRPGDKLLDDSIALSELNHGRGVQAGKIRITDRSGASADIDLSKVRTIDDVITAINDAGVAVHATTENNALKLIDQSGSTLSNLRVEQLGDAETAADLGLWGIDSASNSVTGLEIDRPDGVDSLRGAALTELGGGAGIGTLTNLDITLSDGNSASIDLSTATTTSEIIDAINGSGLKLIAKLNDSRNGFQIRDVSGGEDDFTISSSDSTASALGIDVSTSNDIVVGKNLNRQTVTAETKLSDLNRGQGIGEGSFKITDSSGAISAVNIKASGITTVGGLIEAINDLGIGVTASLNDLGDGIAIIDTASGTGTLKIENTGNGTTATQLGIAGTATEQTVGGSTVSALIGTQSDSIEVVATDTLDSIVAKLNKDPRYAKASVTTNDDGTFSLRLKSTVGGEAGKLAINTTGFNLDLRTDTRGQDAVISVSTDGGIERFLRSSDGVFDLDNSSANKSISGSTLLSELNGGTGIGIGSIKITDSLGAVSALNTRVQNITTVGELIDGINALGLGITASINESGDGIQVIDTAGGTGKLKIEDVGNGAIAANLKLAGEATKQTIGGAQVNALVGSSTATSDTSSGGVVLTIKQLSDSPITVTVSDNPEAVTKAVETFVNQYNLLIDKLDKVTFYDGETGEQGLLFGSNEANRIRDGYSRLLSGRVSQAGDFRSLSQVGIRINSEGKLELNSSKLTEAIEENSSAVEAFFATKDTGLASRLSDLADRIAGPESSMLISRTITIRETIDRTNNRIDQLSSRLDKERERLLKQFYSTEDALAKLQSNSSAIDQIKRITIPE